MLDYETATSHNISVRVADSGGMPYDESFTINLNDINEAPVIAPIADRTMSQVDGQLTVELVASDVDNDSLTYTAQVLGEGEPAILTVSGNQLEIVPQQDFLGSFDVKVSVSDGEFSDSTTFSVEVTLPYGHKSYKPIERTF